MKKLITLALSVLALSMTVSSCSENDPAPSDPMLGHWVLDKYTSTKDGVTSDPKDYTSPTCPDKNYVDLKSSSVLDLGMVNSQTCDVSKAAGTWSVDDNKYLTLNGEGFGTMKFMVSSVEGSKMTLIMYTSTDGQNYHTINCLKK